MGHPVDSSWVCGSGVLLKSHPKRECTLVTKNKAASNFKAKCIKQPMLRTAGHMLVHLQPYVRKALMFCLNQ